MVLLTMKSFFVTAILLMCLMASSAWSQARTKLNVIYPAISGINAPARAKTVHGAS